MPNDDLYGARDDMVSENALLGAVRVLIREAVQILFSYMKITYFKLFWRDWQFFAASSYI